MRQLRKEGQQEPVLIELERRMQQRGQKNTSTNTVSSTPVKQKHTFVLPLWKWWK